MSKFCNLLLCGGQLAFQRSFALVSLAPQNIAKIDAFLWRIKCFAKIKGPCFNSGWIHMQSYLWKQSQISYTTSHDWHEGSANLSINKTSSLWESVTLTWCIHLFAIICFLLFTTHASDRFTCTLHNTGASHSQSNMAAISVTYSASNYTSDFKKNMCANYLSASVGRTEEETGLSPAFPDREMQIDI